MIKGKPLVSISLCRALVWLMAVTVVVPSEQEDAWATVVVQHAVITEGAIGAKDGDSMPLASDVIPRFDDLVHQEVARVARALGQLPSGFIEVHPIGMRYISDADEEHLRLVIREFLLALAVDARVYRWLQQHPRPEKRVFAASLESMVQALAGPAWKRLHEWPQTAQVFRDVHVVKHALRKFSETILNDWWGNAYGLAFTTLLTRVPSDEEMKQIVGKVFRYSDQFQRDMTDAGAGEAPVLADVPPGMEEDAADCNQKMAARRAAEGYLFDIMILASGHYARVAVANDIMKIPHDDKDFMKQYQATLDALDRKEQELAKRRSSVVKPGNMPVGQPTNVQVGQSGSPILKKQPANKP